MTDSWTLAADRIRAQDAVQRAASQETASAAAATYAEQQRREQAAQQELDRAVADATQSLGEFMEQRGAAAQNLLRARGGRAHVIFGEEADGGYYTSVYLYEGGLGKEDGYNGIAVAYSKELQKVPVTKLATPHDAAFYFAYYGMGRKDPATVRNIAGWLTEQVDAIAAK